MIQLIAALALYAPGAQAMSRRPPENKESSSMASTSVLTATDVNPDLFSGRHCGESQPSARIITASKDWEKLWSDSFKAPPPPVDFETHFAVAVFGGSKSTGGYGVEFADPRIDDKTAVIRYRIRKPQPGSFVTQAFTQPYAVKIFKKTPLKVSIEELP